MHSPKISTESGSLILELCIALALFSFTIVGIFGAIGMMANESGTIQEDRMAVYEAQRTLEYALATTFSTRISTTTMSSTDTILTDKLSVAFITPCEQEINSSASWQRGTILDTKNISYVSADPIEYKNIGNDCHGLPTVPVSGIPTPVTLFPSNSFSSSMQISSGDVLNNYVYIGAASSTSSIQNTDFYILDVRNPQKIIQVASLPGPGLQDIDAAGTTVYGAANSTSSQLVIIDTTNPQGPNILNTSTLPDVAPTGSYPGGTSIYYYNNKVYIGTHRTAGNEFHIFNVANPKMPVWLGSIELNHNINAIIIRDTIAYLGTSGNTKDIIMLDISNPASIKQLSSVAFTGSEDTLSINLLGPYLYVGRAKATVAGNAEFNILNITNPAQPVLTGSLAMNDSVNSIAVSGNRAYLGLSNNKLAVIDVSNPTKPALVSTLTLSGSPQALDFEGDTLSIVLKNTLLLGTL